MTETLPTSAAPVPAMPAPVTLAAATAPDADWLTIRDRVAAALTTVPAWTDHNAPEPGITLMEAAAFTVADVHYRLEDAGFADWPLAWPGWLPDDERPWYPALPATQLSDFADAVAALLAVSPRDAEREIAAAPSRRDAESLLAAAPFAAAVAAGMRADAVTLLRSRVVRRVALEHADVIADAVEHADGLGGSPAERDAAATADVVARTGLWPDEAAALVRRERTRLTVEAAAPFAARVEATGPAGLAQLLIDLGHAGLTADEAHAFAARPRVPVNVSPEELEGPDGGTEVWPPHPIQALTCEPVVAEDYARRARTHSAVNRAWAVSGRLKGLAWNGLPTRDPAFVPPAASQELAFGVHWVVDEDAPALTIIVDAPSVKTTDQVTLRAILAHAVGTETYTPAPTWRDTLNPLDPRRLIGDEVGIALLARIQVLVQATLIIPATASATAVTDAAMAAVDAFFTNGRKETPTTIDAPLSGPWEPAPQPEGGWVPGEPVRFSEVVEQLMAVPDVIAVTAMAMRTVEDTEWTQPAAGALELPAGTVPELADQGCFTTAFNVAPGPSSGSCNA
ncbi:hypothetical protein [Demequina sp.]|uniref:hypothetical protein n=1 Tax=Demequina sp. TaxID=2050685 RepID=UPI003D107F63